METTLTATYNEIMFAVMDQKSLYLSQGDTGLMLRLGYASDPAALMSSHWLKTHKERRIEGFYDAVEHALGFSLGTYFDGCESIRLGISVSDTFQPEVVVV